MNKIEEIIRDAKSHGHEARIRDVGYAMLCANLQDSELAYKLIFGDDGNHDAFVKLDRIKYLVDKQKADILKRKSSSEAEDIAKLIAKSKGKNEVTSQDGSMSFEENREGIETQLREIVELKKEAMNSVDGADLKTLALLQKTEADLRVKLNDKFGAAEKTAEQYIIVQEKYNYVCPHTRHECYQMTKERAMAMYNLVEKENNDE